jgi:hypothetical protein
LSLPYINLLAGLALGSLLIVGGAVVAVWSLNMLIISSKIVGCKHFIQLAGKAGGLPTSLLLKAALLLNQFGIICIYQIFCRF